ncbi:MAG: hypothetical protein C0609_02410 [Deltaproteobacteria bacterium]|nr:MAG: hypothetical protein C0609_02410 [Deltaproteobacteria bacterium]
MMSAIKSGTKSMSAFKGRVASALLLCAVPFMLTACWDKTTVAAKPDMAAAKPTGPSLNSMLEGVIPSENESKEIFSYNSNSLRDPFMPFVKIEPKKNEETKKAKTVFKPKTPLQRFALEELAFVGVMWGGGEKAMALIQDPKDKGYRVGVGTLIGDRGGKIVKIMPDEVVVREYVTDTLGNSSVKDITLTLHKDENEVSP